MFVLFRDFRYYTSRESRVETTEKERRNKNNKRKSRPETVIYCDEGVFALLRLSTMDWEEDDYSCFAYLLLCEITS